MGRPLWHTACYFLLSTTNSDRVRRVLQKYDDEIIENFASEGIDACDNCSLVTAG
jgi:hypothetical protein